MRVLWIGSVILFLTVSACAKPEPLTFVPGRTYEEQQVDRTFGMPGAPGAPQPVSNPCLEKLRPWDAQIQSALSQTLVKHLEVRQKLAQVTETIGKMFEKEPWNGIVPTLRAVNLVAVPNLKEELKISARGFTEDFRARANQSLKAAFGTDTPDCEVDAYLFDSKEPRVTLTCGSFHLDLDLGNRTYASDDLEPAVFEVSLDSKLGGDELSTLPGAPYQVAFKPSASIELVLDSRPPSDDEGGFQDEEFAWMHGFSALPARAKRSTVPNSPDWIDFTFDSSQGKDYEFENYWTGLGAFRNQVLLDVSPDECDPFVAELGPSRIKF